MITGFAASVAGFLLLGLCAFSANVASVATVEALHSGQQDIPTDFEFEVRLTVGVPRLGQSRAW